MTRHPTSICLGDVARTVVPATVHAELTPQELLAAETAWKPVRDAAIASMRAAGVPPVQLPEHHHWDWAAKASQLKYLSCRAFGIECGEEYQGLMMVDLSRAFARLPPDSGKPLVYVDFLETAPWNSKLFTATPKYAGIGSVLFRIAVQTSIDEGFRGRIGLHSLPQSVDFYATHCGMINCGSDPTYYNLPYLERHNSSPKRSFGENQNQQPNQQYDPVPHHPRVAARDGRRRGQRLCVGRRTAVPS